jgi:hypothetical protein
MNCCEWKRCRLLLLLSSNTHLLLLVLCCKSCLVLLLTKSALAVVQPTYGFGKLADQAWDQYQRQRRGQTRRLLLFEYILDLLA